MGDVAISNPGWKQVEVGRVVLLQGNRPDAGHLAAVIEIIDHKRVCESALLLGKWSDLKQALVDGPSSDPALRSKRQEVPLSDCLLSSIVIETLPRGAREGKVKKCWNEVDVDGKWKETNWYKKSQQLSKRKNLSDFDRFKVMRLKKQRRFEQRKALAKIKASA